MATLFSEESETRSSLSLTPKPNARPAQKAAGQIWQAVEVKLVCGDRIVQTRDDADNYLCRTPSDEVTLLLGYLRDLIAHKRDKVFFEPNEPSFEILFERAHKGGIKVQAWIDAGNASTGFYTYDALGIRFYTNDDLLVSFITATQDEFFPTTQKTE